jgi:hypothetical protein
MDYETFTSFCDKKLCLRKCFYNDKTCRRDSKRQSCFSKYSKKQEEVFIKKTTFDPDEQKFREAVWIRDFGSYPEDRKILNWERYCRYWNSLSEEEKVIVKENYFSDLYMNTSLEVAHIKGKGSNPNKEDKYNPDNALLIGHLFHRLIDDYINPLNKKKMSKEERLEIFNVIKDAERKIFTKNI